MNEYEKWLKRWTVWVPLGIYAVMLVMYIVLGVFAIGKSDYSLKSLCILCISHVVYAVIDIGVMLVNNRDVKRSQFLERLLAYETDSEVNGNVLRLVYSVALFILLGGELALSGFLSDRNHFVWAIISPYSTTEYFKLPIVLVLLVGCILEKALQFGVPLHYRDRLEMLKKGESSVQGSSVMP